MGVSLFDEESLTNLGKAVAHAIQKLFSIATTTDYAMWQCFLKIKSIRTQNEIAIFSNYIKLSLNVNSMILYIEQQNLIKSRYIPSDKDNKRRQITKDAKILPFGLREESDNRCNVQMIQDIIDKYSINTSDIVSGQWKDKIIFGGWHRICNIVIYEKYNVLMWLFDMGI
ncbi:MAG: hypothetical protein GY938_05530, partial [Ketobacter sp.]|nr:hypothetical protein [Ketobacter sp.]